jgi:glycosyltransferase involved in cell wall biosynthesis/UDP-N-acetyl-D-mannosaminuronic acid transferase (WecB/TagA/CpsF family)
LKILVITQYFWPETFRVNDIVRYLKEKNYDVDVLTGLPNYPEGILYEEFKTNRQKFNDYYGAKIFRVPLFLRRDASKFYLFLNYISFVISAIIFGSFVLRKKKYDIVFSFATSPLTSSLPAVFFSKIKSCRSFIWVLDIWPDILKELKIINNNFIYNIVSNISKFIYKKFDYILVQSNSFKQIIKKYTSNNNNFYFPAWAEDINGNKTNQIKYNNDKSFKIVFTGNIGEAQNFDNVIETARILKDHDDIKWIIVGTGREIENISRTIKKENIKNFFLEGKKNINDISYYHSIADVLFISLKSGDAISSTIPGKLQTYLQSNKFILGMISGEGKKIIEDSGTGCCVDPSRPKDLAEKILYLKNNPEIIKQVNQSNRGKDYLYKFFNKKIIFEKLTQYFDEAYNSLETIHLIKDASYVPYDKSFILSGFNLAFLGYVGSNKIKLSSSLLAWPDGIFKRRFYGSDIPKVSGLKLINNLKIPNKIKNIYILGLLSSNSHQFLKKKFSNQEIIHVDLPFGSIENIYKQCPVNFTEEDLIICTLPTPKQEQLAELIEKNNKYYKIICIGGAISVASGDEKVIPKLFDRLNIEFIWRLRTDTRRRILRLIHTFYFYIYAEMTLRYKKIKFRKIS